MWKMSHGEGIRIRIRDGDAGEQALPSRYLTMLRLRFTPPLQLSPKYCKSSDASRVTPFLLHPCKLYVAPPLSCLTCVLLNPNSMFHRKVQLPRYETSSRIVYSTPRLPTPTRLSATTEIGPSDIIQPTTRGNTTTKTSDADTNVQNDLLCSDRRAPVRNPLRPTYRADGRRRSVHISSRLCRSTSSDARASESFYNRHTRPWQTFKRHIPPDQRPCHEASGICRET